ncbi:hypothetical protein PHAVU_005G164700 [Phaseolus vulgaris]
MDGKWRCHWAWSFTLWCVLVYTISEFSGKSVVLATEKNSMHHKQERKLHDVSGSICIDCGIPEKATYTDEKTQIPYTSDALFIDTGTSKNISLKLTSEIPQRIFTTVRSFPEEKRNCYKLQHPERRDTIYLIRASFMFEEDAYDRIWYPYNLPDSTPISTSNTIDSVDHTAYHLPPEAMKTAVRPTNENGSLEFEFDTEHPTSDSYVYLHFAEIEKLKENESRVFDITLNGKILSESVTPKYLQSTTIESAQAIRGSKLKFSIHKKPSSTHPPILNAMEIYVVKEFLHSPTDQEDVKAITDIKSYYKLLSLDKSWRGDPCAPLKYSWNGIKCSNNGYKSPTITALNLASSGLDGPISGSFSQLKFLEFLDLSNNSLTGPLPDFSELQYLKTLNLSGNRLSGEIPPLLLKRSKNGSLMLSVDPDLCRKGPCEKAKKNIVPLVAGILSALLFFIVLGCVLIIIWRRYNRKPASKQGVRSNEEFVLKTNNKQFSYSEIRTITNNFEKTIGKGGYGIVYLGYLKDGTQAAVKMLLSKSPEGSQQFQTEAQLLIRVHHKNLASFLGYCNEVGHTAIIYEYMTNGNLEDYLSDAKREPLSWRQRIQIALDAAQGIEYLHHGCKPPIVHRDIKTANILLNEKLQAKVADFGFSKLFSAENESHVSTIVIGTVGYLDPEYYISSRLTEKSDVYSFGIVLLELITGQPAIIKGHNNTHIVQWVNQFLERGDILQIVDPKMQGDFDFGSMWKALEAAVACVPSISIQRPSMNHIVGELKESLKMEATREKEGINSIEMNVVDLEAGCGPDAR